MNQRRLAELLLLHVEYLRLLWCGLRRRGVVRDELVLERRVVCVARSGGLRVKWRVMRNCEQHERLRATDPRWRVGHDCHRRSYQDAVRDV